MPPASFSAHQNPQRTLEGTPPALLDELFEHPAGLFFTGSARCASRALGGFVNAWNAGAYPAEDFIRNCADPACYFISPD